MAKSTEVMRYLHVPLGVRLDTSHQLALANATAKLHSIFNYCTAAYVCCEAAFSAIQSFSQPLVHDLMLTNAYVASNPELELACMFWWVEKQLQSTWNTAIAHLNDKACTDKVRITPANYHMGREREREREELDGSFQANLLDFCPGWYRESEHVHCQQLRQVRTGF